LAWGHLTRLFFEAYPDQKAKAQKTETGRPKAQLDAKIYHALSMFVPELLGREFRRGDQQGTVFKIGRLAIDTRWGQASGAIKRWIAESGFQNVVPYLGQYYPPTNRQLEEYQRTGQYASWLFEDQVHPQVKEPKWVIRPNPDGQWYMSADVNRLKDFLFSRLATPPGSPGSISLFNASPDQHEMFADHVAGSEYPEPVTARGMKKNMWQERMKQADNDWLDVAVGCCALASWQGACLKTVIEDATPVKPRSLAEQAKAARTRRGKRQ